MAKWWLAFAIGGLAATVLTLVATQKLAAMELSQVLGWPNAAGLSMTFWGLVISVAGFTATWWQLGRTQTSAEAVSEAIVHLKKDFASFELITEIRAARSAAESAQSHVSAERWRDALSNYNTIRTSLSKMIASNEILNSSFRELAKDYLASSLEACNVIERQTHDVESVSKAVLNSTLRDLDNFLISLEVSLKESIRGG